MSDFYFIYELYTFVVPVIWEPMGTESISGNLGTAGTWEPNLY